MDLHSSTRKKRSSIPARWKRSATKWELQFPGDHRSQKTLVMNVIREEENSFLRTLDQGLAIAGKRHLGRPKAQTVSGQPRHLNCTILSDFPIDLTALILTRTKS
jgi:alanyl-tRNA synthetase